MFVQRLAHSPFAGFLASAVNPERGDRVVLAIRADPAAVKDVIGRDVDQRDSGVAARRGEVCRPGAVAGPGGLALALGPVDGRVGRRIHDNVGPLVREGGENRVALCDVESAAVQRDNFPARRPRGSAQFAPDLPAGPDHQNLHRRPRYR